MECGDAPPPEAGQPIWQSSVSCATGRARVQTSGLGFLGRPRIGPRTHRSANNAAGYADIFSGKDLTAAAGLSLIGKFRGMSQQLAAWGAADPGASGPSQVDRFLQARSAKDFNAVLNLLHRVEIRVPGHFFSTDFQHLESTSLARMQLTHQPRAILDSPSPEKLKALTRYCAPRGGTP